MFQAPEQQLSQEHAVEDVQGGWREETQDP